MNEGTAEKARSVSELAQNLARLAITVITGLYAVGLLIINFNLAQYDLARLDLNRAEYIMAGALWGFFSTITSGYISFFTLAQRFPRGFGQPLSFWRFCIAIGSASIIAGGLFASISSFEPSKLRELFAVAVAGLLIVTAGPFWLLILFAMIEPRDSPPARRPGELWQTIIREGSFAGSVVVFSALLLGLRTYATTVFPELPRSFGGGRPPAVDLVLTEMPDLPWKSLGVPYVDCKRKFIGPVLLLTETDHIMFFKPLLIFRIPQEVFGIKKEAIQAIIYRPGLREGSSSLIGSDDLHPPSGLFTSCEPTAESTN